MEHRAEGQFGEAVQLLGYDLGEPCDPGGKLTLTLYWRALTSPEKSYLVFVHLVDGTGKLIAQADGMPANWLRPTTTWREGEVIIDEHTLTLPPELPEDTYHLYVGLYEPDGQRLPVVAQEQLLPNERLPLEASNGMDW